MDSDSENIPLVKNAPDDIFSLAEGIGFKKIKISFFIFIIFILISSDVFVDRILSGNDGYVEGRYVTDKGTMIQGVVMTICYIVISCLIDLECI